MKISEPLLLPPAISAQALDLAEPVTSFAVDFTVWCYFQHHKFYPLTMKDRPSLSHMECSNICTQPLRPCQYLFAHFSHTVALLYCSTSRYPTSKWVKLGTFHARDERIVQSFPLDEQHFAKYLKVLLFFFFFSTCLDSPNISEGEE